MSNETDIAGPVKTGVQVLSEYLLPGGSNLVNGNIEQAGIHAVLGFAAMAVLGVPGLLLVSANSIAKAKTGHHLHEYMGMMNSNFGLGEKVKPTPTK